MATAAHRTRLATAADAAAIASIDNEPIADRIATFETENTASLALHGRCGFRVVGVYQRHGKLEGPWRDCIIVERLLGPAENA
jgi:phosphinothricin acetyltransferase